MNLLKLNLILPLLSSIYCCIDSGVSTVLELVLVVALPHINSSGADVSVSWERGQEILPGALAAVDHINNKDHSVIVGNKLILLIADSDPVTSIDYPYSGNVLEVIANLTSQNARVLSLRVVELLHPKLLAILQSFQLRITSLINFAEFHQLQIFFT